MLTRVLFALVVIAVFVADACAQDAKVLALGIADHEVTKDEAEKGGTLPVPRFNTPAIAYVLAAGLKKGDTAEIALFNEGKSLLHNTQTLGEDEAKLLLQAGKRGVPAG